MDYMPPIYVQRIGDPRFPRFIYRDSGGQYFTPSKTWSEYPGEAAVYFSVADAVADERRFVDCEHVRDTYTLKIVVITDKDAWSREQLVQHLTRFCAIVMERNQERRGVVLEVHWDDLHKTF
jgi:hypothetical protein